MVLPAPRRAHQRDHVAGERLERDVVEQDLHLAPCCRDRAPRGRGPTPRSRRAACPPTGLTSSMTTLPLSASGDDGSAAASGRCRPSRRLHRDALARREALAAHEGAVGAAEILDEELARPVESAGVLAQTCGWLTTMSLSGVRPMVAVRRRAAL